VPHTLLIGLFLGFSFFYWKIYHFFFLHNENHYRYSAPINPPPDWIYLFLRSNPKTPKPSRQSIAGGYKNTLAEHWTSRPANRKTGQAELNAFHPKRSNQRWIHQYDGC
jgi:hypothetical protein